MEEHRTVYKALLRLSDPWYRAWFARSTASPAASTPFVEADPSVRELLFRHVLASDECQGAFAALHVTARRTLESIQLMYALADYFDDESPGQNGSRGSRWSGALSKCLKAARRMALDCGRLGADAVRASVEGWATDVSIRGAMFFPTSRKPRSWRTVARRLLRADLTIRQIAILETAWLVP